MPPSPIYRCAVLTAPAVRQMKREIRWRPFLETGGPMVGYVCEGRVIVTAVAGPGRRGKCRPDSVTIDGAHSTTFAEQARAKSNGRIDYVGDWHRHLAQRIVTSARDYEALHLLTHHPGFAQQPISIIVTRGCEGASAFVLVDDRMAEVPVRVA